MTLGSNLTAEIIARAGYDWLLIDLEHGAGDFRDLAGQHQAIEASQAVPIVRVPANEPWLFKRSLPEVDVVFIGPGDLTVAYGVPGHLNSEIVQAALTRVEHAASKHGKSMGILLPGPEEVPLYRDRGYQFIDVGSKVTFISRAARSAIEAARSGTLK